MTMPGKDTIHKWIYQQEEKNTVKVEVLNRRGKKAKHGIRSDQWMDE